MPRSTPSRAASISADTRCPRFTSTRYTSTSVASFSLPRTVAFAGTSVAVSRLSLRALAGTSFSSTVGNGPTKNRWYSVSPSAVRRRSPCGPSGQSAAILSFTRTRVPASTGAALPFGPIALSTTSIDSTAMPGS